MFAYYLNTERDRTQKCFAFSYTPLMYNDGTTLQDGTHELVVYKVKENTLITQTLMSFFLFIPRFLLKELLWKLYMYLKWESTVLSWGF